MRRRKMRHFRPDFGPEILECRTLLSTLVAVVDSGIDPSNTADAIRIRSYTEFSSGYNAVTQQTAAQGGDLYDVMRDSDGINRGYGHHHGTVVADLASQAVQLASSQPGAGATVGNVKIMPIRVTDSNGDFVPSAAIEGIFWAVDHKASAINLSWVVSGNTPISGSQYPHNGQTMTAAVQYAAANNVVFLAPAGNSGVDVDANSWAAISPASLNEPNILVSAAVDASGNLTSASNWGPNYADIGSLTDSGGATSFASGYTTGVAGVIAAMLPANHTYSTVINTIKNTVTLHNQAKAAIPASWSTTNGVINVAAAISSIPPLSGPAAPTISSATLPAPGQVTLTWSQVAGASSYAIQRSLNGGAYSVISNTTVNAANPALATSFTDAGLAAGSYAYQVKATAGGVDSAWSAAATAANVAAAPAALFATDFAGPTGGLPAPWYTDNTTGGTWSQTNGVASQSDSTTSADPKKVSPILSQGAQDDNTQIVAKVRIDQWAYGPAFRVGVGLNTSSGTGHGYNLIFVNSGGTKQVQFLNDMVAFSPAVAFNFSEQTWYWFKMLNQGGTLYGKVWQDGATEPAAWTIQQDLNGAFIGAAPLPAGYPALNGGTEIAGMAGSVAASFDDVAVSHPSSQALVDRTAESGGIVSARGQNAPGQEAANLFDNNLATNWLDFSATSWVQYQFANGAAYAITEYAITSGGDTATYPGRAPKSWILKGSNDGTNWTTLDTRTNQADTANIDTRTYDFSNATAFKIYRLDDIQSNGDPIVQLTEIRLRGPAGAITELAQGKAAYSSSNEGASYTPEKAVDGDGATRWSSGQWAQGGNIGWIYVDLGASHAISEVDLNWEAGFAADYQIQVSDDATNWTTLKAITGNASSGTVSHAGLSGYGRYVRIYCTMTSAANNYSLYDIKVYGY